MTQEFSKLVDGFQRHINYFRVSVTDRCNLHCLYCMPRKGLPKLSHEEILTYEEILRILRVATTMGITKVRVTGGEPFARKGLLSFLERLTSLPGLQDISLTTNGVLAAQHLQHIWEMGIRRINISLDTLSRERYRQITGIDGFDRVWESIDKARTIGFDPIRINMVVIAGLNDHEVLDFARLSITSPYQIRFIEYMPIGPAEFSASSRFVPTSVIKEKVEALGPLIPVNNSRFDGPAQRYRLEGARGELGFISPISEHFCGRCNRMRLTADGKLRDCLLSDLSVDLKGPIRAGISDAELANLLVEAAGLKPSGHTALSSSIIAPSGTMSSIGG